MVKNGGILKVASGGQLQIFGYDFQKSDLCKTVFFNLCAGYWFYVGRKRKKDRGSGCCERVWNQSKVFFSIKEMVLTKLTLAK